ncbi:hypothetical protein FRUB_01828 [Fimbriiglobus ruber]|uniref:Uncharacterized protein n=1 Tax=Fimbriiglobus ruber TaxID=1908690 RepID=A0A225EAR6_9BACT|nr:hypothetical protein FRUB_01828 [Fimbriiglobus ruber]
MDHLGNVAEFFQQVAGHYVVSRVDIHAGQVAAPYPSRNLANWYEEYSIALVHGTGYNPRL